MVRSAEAIRRRCRCSATESRGSSGSARRPGRNLAHVAFASASALPRIIASGSREHSFGSGGCQRGVALSSPHPDGMNLISTGKRMSDRTDGGENVTESAGSHAAVPLETSIPADVLPLEAILCTEELRRRPSRPPDYEKENRSLEALARALAYSPRTILQTLTETIIDITQSDSSGVSLLMPDGNKFYWPAIAGRWTPHIGGGSPRDWGPCGVVIDRNMPLLMRHLESRYTYFLPISPPPVECLLVPFYLGGKAVGTIWAVIHDDRRKFDAEDERLMTRLSTFASTAYQTLETIDELRFQISEHQKAERAVRVNVCPKCGRPLTQVGPDGECLRCVFDWGFTSKTEGSEDPTR